jgi:hypothetical protein
VEQFASVQDGPRVGCVVSEAVRSARAVLQRASTASWMSEELPISVLELWLDLPSHYGALQQGVNEPPGALGISYDMELDAADIQMHQ